MPRLLSTPSEVVLKPADRRLLRALQADSSRSLTVLAEQLGLSTSACHRRIRQLEAAGLIEGYVARLDRQALGLALEAFVAISLTSQSEEALSAFEQAVAANDEILECHLLAGQGDFLIRVAARSVEHFDDIHRTCLARLPGVSSMQSNFVLRAIKPWRGYPVAAP